MESDIIVGVIDFGIWPEWESFSDEGFSPPLKKWKGACKGGTKFTCDNKIIGARFYQKGDKTTARDIDGHGSHTASTAAGDRVEGVTCYGIAQSPARGRVLLARIVAYKVCPRGYCSDADILAAFDDVIAGVDIITISIGGYEADQYDKDSIAIGAFLATQKGILTVNAEGNDGPVIGTISRVAPWMLSVAAITLIARLSTRLFLPLERH